MEKKKRRSIPSDTVKSATDILGKVKDTLVKAVDQNDDGSLDQKDISAIAESIGKVAKNTAAVVKESAEEKSLELKRKELMPIFFDDLDSADFMLPKLIRITEIDKKRAGSFVCKGSIGFMSIIRELSILNIFNDKVDSFGLTFYPDTESDVYYMDPSDRSRYIALDEYFNYLKIVRVNELQKIAQDLGAKHFKVIYRERTSTAKKNSVKAKISLKEPSIADVKQDMEHELASNEVESVEIAAESIFPGHDPVEPKLKYLQKDPLIQGLIALRMDKSAPCSHQSYVLKLSNTTGIKEKDAMKIDAALKTMKLSGGISVTNEAINETNRFFEYEVDF